MAAAAYMLSAVSTPSADERRATLPRPQGAVLKRTTAHLSMEATLSPAVAVVGSRISILVDVVPKRGMHVYAPGTQYRPIALVLTPSPLFRVHEPVYPEPQTYLFKPLNERVLVYSSPFRLRVDVTLDGTRDQDARMSKPSRVAVTGRLEYQACDDRVCYLPAKIPLEWTVRVEPRR
jgi:hypothetical protein